MQVVILHTVEVIHITLKSIKKGRRVKTTDEFLMHLVTRLRLYLVLG